VTAPKPDPDRRPELRAADVDREQVIERLRLAQFEGRLDINEFDERVAAAWAARTYGELDTLTADLPPPVARPTGAVAPPSRDPDRSGPGRPVVAAWLTASLVNVVIWGIVSVSTASFVYPWWIWVAGPWGAVILVGWLVSRTQRE
jgi:hypothetical protein